MTGVQTCALPISLFTERASDWWPEGVRHTGDPRSEIRMLANGRFWERATDGHEVELGRVLVWEPAERLVITWQIGADWKYHADQASEIEVSFTPSGAQTSVVLEHRHIERHGDGAAQMRDTVGSEGGWPTLLELYRGVLESSSSAAELMQ